MIGRLARWFSLADPDADPGQPKGTLDVLLRPMADGRWGWRVDEWTTSPSRSDRTCAVRVESGCEPDEESARVVASAVAENRRRRRPAGDWRAA